MTLPESPLLGAAVGHRADHDQSILGFPMSLFKIESLAVLIIKGTAQNGLWKVPDSWQWKAALPLSRPTARSQ